MSAWSLRNPESIDALFTTAAGDTASEDHVRDLFAYALEWAQSEAAEAANPHPPAHRLA
ncbi:hypothetical protein ACWGLF_41370 [Streptomyces puniciscabiei]